jgi:8-oxo-dGTP diphosphatase
MKQKVLAYIIRVHDGEKQLLLLLHRDYPEAGIQVPGGTVEPGEAFESALLREVYEETGLTNVKIIKKLTDCIFFNTYKQEEQERHVYLLDTVSDTKEEWEHVVEGEGEDKGLVYKFIWSPIDNLPMLRSDHGNYIEFL